MEDIQRNYLTKAWAQMHLEDPWTVQVELRYLAMYVIDGLIKYTQGRNWPEHREALAKGFYAACYRACSSENVEDQDHFLLELYARQSYYNDGLSECIEELSKIADAETKFVRTTTILSQLFAEQCGRPDNPQYRLIAAGATTAIYIATQKIFQSGLTT